MTVTDMWIDDIVIRGFPRLDDETLHSLKSFDKFKSPISDIMLAMAICNKAEFDYDGKDVRFNLPDTPIESPAATVQKPPASAGQARAMAILKS